MDPETIRIIKLWKGKPRSLSVRVALWEATRDVVGYFVGTMPKVDYRPQEVHLLVRENTPAECQVTYSSALEQDFLKLNQFIHALGRNNIGARAILFEIGGLTDPWDQKKIKELELSILEIMALIILNKEEGESWGELMDDINQQDTTSTKKPK